jgi:hypothetical protein
MIQRDILRTVEVIYPFGGKSPSIWLTLVIPVTWKAKIGSWFESNPSKKVDLHLNKLGVNGAHLQSSCMGGEGRRMAISGWPGQKVRLYLKNNRSKKD